MKQADGGFFEGEWLNNERHGLGIMIYADGERFEGRWLED